jgi:hypothetical protein
MANTITIPNNIINIPANSSPTTIAEYNAAVQATQTAIVPLLTQVTSQLTTLGVLRYKVDSNTATNAEISQYTQVRNNLIALAGNIASTGTLDPDTEAKIQQQLVSAKLTSLKSEVGNLTVATFTDFLQYVFRTQALNPYSRERACDLDFIDMLTHIGADISQQQELLNTLKSLVTNITS